jgi:hypothetical protein
MRALLLGLVTVLLPALPAAAWDAAKRSDFERALDDILASRFETTSGLAGAEHRRVQFGAYTTFSGLGADDEAGHTRIQRQVDSKLWVESHLEGHTLYGRLRLRYQDFNEGDSFTGGGDDLVVPVGDRYWYQFDWRADQRAEQGTDPDNNFWARIGRQQVHWGGGTVLSMPLYAARGGAEAGSWRFEGLVGQTPGHTVDFDGSRPGYTTDTDRFFWGALVGYEGWAAHHPYAYFVGQEDDNDTTIFGGASRFQYDSSYAVLGATGQLTGQLLYRTELVKEFGDSISNATGIQTIEDIDAWAARFELVYSLHRYRATSRIRFEFEALLASGDDDRGHSAATVFGNQSGTDDRSFNAFGDVYTGLALAPDLSNLLSLRFTVSAFPFHRKSALGKFRTAMDVFLLGKLDEDAPMSVSTLPGERYLGIELDFLIEWQLFHDLAFDLRYGIFVPGEAYFTSDPRHFLYAAFSYAF